MAIIAEICEGEEEGYSFSLYMKTIGRYFEAPSIIDMVNSNGLHFLDRKEMLWKKKILISSKFENDATPGLDQYSDLPEIAFFWPPFIFQLWPILD